jgi:DNA-binding IclR family transcriptional regulator
MIQVIHRAAAILQIVSEQPDRNWSVADLAEQLDINATTCANIVRSLMEAGYLETNAGRKGYSLGPTPYYLTRKGPYMQELIEIARPFLVDLTKRVDETSLISVLRNYTKVVLCHIDRDNVLRLRTEYIERQNPYGTATGRLLIAYLDPKTRRKFADIKGLPGEAWDDITTIEGLEDACSNIREAGFCVDGKRSGALTGVAFPIIRELGKGREPVAALGLFLPSDRFQDTHETDILSAMREISAELGRALAIYTTVPSTA